MANSPYEAELEALMFLLGQIKDSAHKKAHIVLFSDCKVLVTNMASLRKKTNNHYLASGSHSLLTNFKLILIDRLLNKEADSLAKDGGNKKKILKGWIHLMHAGISDSRAQ